MIRTPDPTATPTETPLEIVVETPAPPEPIVAPEATAPAAEGEAPPTPLGGPIIVPSAETPLAEETLPVEPPLEEAEPTEAIDVMGATETLETTPQPAAPANTPGGTPIALLDAQPVSPTPLPPSLTPSPAPTQIVARPASVSGGADTQPYLIGGILGAAGWRRSAGWR